MRSSRPLWLPRRCRAALLVLVACAAPPVAAPAPPQPAASQRTPGPWTPAIDAPVVDLSGKVSDAAEERLGRALRAHRDATGVQIAVLLIDTLGGEPIEDFSLRVAEAWGGGSAGRDDGMLVTFAASDRRMRIEVGYGLEAQVPDRLAKQILDDAKPDLRVGDWDAAVEEVAAALRTQTAEGAPAPGAYVPRAEREARARTWMVLTALLFVILAVVAGFATGLGFREGVPMGAGRRWLLRLALPATLLALLAAVLAFGFTRWALAPAVVFGAYGIPYGRDEERQRMALIFFSAFGLIMGGAPALGLGAVDGGAEVALGILAGMGALLGLMGLASSKAGSGGSSYSSGSYGSSSTSTWSSSSSSSSSTSSSSSASSSSYSGGGGSYGGGGASSSW